MKKLLVLALVLAVAGIANAGLTLVKVTDTQAAVVSDDVLSYNAYLTIPLVIGHDIVFTANAGGSSSIAHELYGDGLDWAFITVASNPANGTLNKVGQQVFVNLLGGKKFGTLPSNDVLQLMNSAGTEVIASLNIIPEPMTMVLLGLGGLFLRKKK